MNTVDLFDLNRPGDLYRIVLDTYKRYLAHPTEADFLFLVLGFTHMREWISESDRGQIADKKKAGATLTDGEQFFEEIYAMPEFRVIQELCNRGKHHITKGSAAKTSKAEGLRAGLARAGDKLDQTYFLIDGRDSRDYFIELVHKYNSWFSKHGW
jgi:hypothetical protein